MPDTTMTPRETPPVKPDAADDRRITLRIPSILAARLDSDLKKRQQDTPRLSMNDWIVEAIRRKVDGPPLVKASALPPRDQRRDVPQAPTAPQSNGQQPWKPSPPPPQTFDWTARFNYWAGRDQAGVIERQEFLAESGVPIDILGRPPDKILTWCKYHLPNGPTKEQHEEEVQSTEEDW